MLIEKINIIKSVKLLFAISVLVVLSACHTIDTSKNWPNDLPDRRIFVNDYLKRHNVKKVDPRVLDNHLIWIIRFYHGTAIYPNGWNHASALLLASVEGEQKKRIVEQKTHNLGILMVNEWAQENGIRNIVNSNIATWGSALRTAAERDDQINFLNKVKMDVEALIARQLKPSDISYERYYPEEQYDNF